MKKYTAVCLGLPMQRGNFEPEGNIRAMIDFCQKQKICIVGGEGQKGVDLKKMAESKYRVENVIILTEGSN